MRTSKKLFRNFVIIAEEGVAKHTPEEMDKIDIKQFVLDDSRIEDIFEHVSPDIAAVRGFKCYTVGTESFIDRVKTVGRGMGLDWRYLPCSSEETVLEQEDIPSPFKKREKASLILDEMENDSISRSDLAGVMMAAEEISDRKIFPSDDEYVYDAFLKIVESYIPNRERAKKAADYYLLSRKKS